MKILLTTISLDSSRGGGTAERSRQMALALKEKGHDCTIVAIDGGDYVEGLEAAGVEVYVMGFTRAVFTIPHMNLARLAGYVRQADGIHILGFWNLLSVATAAICRQVDKRYLLSVAGEFAGLVNPKPVHKLYNRIFGRSMIKGASAMVAITELERQQISKRASLPPDKVFVLPNGVKQTAPAASSNVLPPRPYALFVGRLTEIKGPDLLIEAFVRTAAQYPEFDLVVAGPDFGLGPKLEKLVAEAALTERVHLIGFLGEAERTLAYMRAAFLCVPSRSEAMSLVALEAAIAGTPVLLTDQCGFDSVAAMGGGRVVPATVDGLEAGLHWMFENAGSLPEMGERLRDYVKHTFTWDQIADDLLDLFTRTKMSD